MPVAIGWALTGPSPKAAAVTYEVDTGSSRVYALVSAATRLGHSHGIEGRLASGSVTPGGTGTLVFDMTTFEADAPGPRQYVGLEPKFSRSDAQKVNANMRGPAVLDVGQFPKAVFEITAFTPQEGQPAGDPGRYQVEGQFTLHGATHGVHFPATIERTDQPGVYRLAGEFGVMQTQYGIQPFSALGGLVRIEDQLKIWGDLRITAAAGK